MKVFGSEDVMPANILFQHAQNNKKKFPSKIKYR